MLYRHSIALLVKLHHINRPFLGLSFSIQTVLCAI